MTHPPPPGGGAPAPQPPMPLTYVAPVPYGGPPTAHVTGMHAPVAAPDQFDSRATKPVAPLPVVRAPMPSTIPTTHSIPAPNMPRKKKAASGGGGKGKLALLIGAAVFGAMVLAIGVIGIVKVAARGGVNDAIVRVATPTGNGTGFFIKGPDHHAYVATAFHVVERGEHVLIERTVNIDDETTYTEAFPETEVVAFDADADIAIIRIKNIDASRFTHLDLADQPMANEAVRSFGYPASKITSRAGLIAKDGKLLSLVKFPVYDRREKRIVRDNAVDGLLVSAELEPGFSGGPTVNDSDDIVGINVTKDMVHRGQNGVVHVKLLRALLETVKPIDGRVDPTQEDVSKLLSTIEREYLRLPISERRNEREHAFIATSELPRLRELIDEVRRHERDSNVAEGAKLSGRAALGMWAAQMPGKALATYLSGDVQDSLTTCERSSVRLVSMFSGVGESDIDDKKAAEAAALQGCDELALRPLAWDLLAATLQFTGDERQYTVTTLERVDEASDVWRAKVRVSGMKNLLSLWVTRDYGELRVKLFDSEGRLYGVKNASEVEPSEIAGEWHVSRPRAPSHGLEKTEEETVESVSVSVQGRDVTVKHVVERKYYATSTAGLFRCNSSREIDNGLSQSFSGTLDNGVIVATPKEEAKRIGRDAVNCRFGYNPDVMVAFKLVNGKLAMHRTDGVGFPETVELERK